jgi:hypothetical protein
MTQLAQIQFTYHSSIISERVGQASLIFFQDAHNLPKLHNYEEYVTGGKPIAV